MSLATIRSGQPSPSGSQMITPSDFATGRSRASAAVPSFSHNLDARGLGHVRELPAAEVAVERALRAFELLRLLVRPANPGQRCLDGEIDCRRPCDIAANEEVELAVAVVIDERRGARELDRLFRVEELLGAEVTRPCTFRRDARGRCLVHELALATLRGRIAIELATTDAGDEQFREAIVVDVAGTCASAVHGRGQSRGRGRVLEGAVSLVAVEREARCRGLLWPLLSRPRTAVDEE